MLGLPLWLYAVLPFVAFAVMFWIIHRTKKLQDELRPQRKLPSMTPLFASLCFVLVTIVLGAGASGQYEENRVQAECAKHGMKGFRAAWGRSRCIDDKGQLVAFDDVR